MSCNNYKIFELSWSSIRCKNSPDSVFFDSDFSSTELWTMSNYVTASFFVVAAALLQVSAVGYTYASSVVLIAALITAAVAGFTSLENPNSTYRPQQMIWHPSSTCRLNPLIRPGDCHIQGVEQHGSWVRCRHFWVANNFDDEVAEGIRSNCAKNDMISDGEGCDLILNCAHLPPLFEKFPSIDEWSAFSCQHILHKTVPLRRFAYILMRSQYCHPTRKLLWVLRESWSDSKMWDC